MALDERRARAEQVIGSIEAELKAQGWWQDEPLAPERFEGMGAFGENTMTFPQWLQFVLVPRVRSIVAERGDLPDRSMLAVYAARYFDGDRESAALQALLRELDEIVASPAAGGPAAPAAPADPGASDTVTLGQESLPAVLQQLAAVLHQFEGQDLESQLETYDVFLGILSPKARPALADLLAGAAGKAAGAATRSRLEQAAASVRSGGAAARG